MVHLMIILGLLLGPVGEEPELQRRCGVEQPRPRAPGTVRLASWNVLNLFDHADDPALQGQWDDLPMATAHGRCAAIAAVIREIDADVLALQEVESQACLEWFRGTWLADMGYEHLVSLDAGYFRGVECSLLSRWPVVSSTIELGVEVDDTSCGPGKPIEQPDSLETPVPFRRPPMQVVLSDPTGNELTVLVVHHKAGGGRANTWRREAEACSVLEVLSGLEAPGRRVAVMGDFNATPGDRSVRAYLESGLVDVMAHRAALGDPERPTWATHESGRVIDYMLVTPSLAVEIVPGSAHVVGVPSPPRGWDWRTDPRPDGAASDHMPLVVDLLFSRSKVTGSPPSADSAGEPVGR